VPFSHPNKKTKVKLKMESAVQKQKPVKIFAQGTEEGMKENKVGGGEPEVAAFAKGGRNKPPQAK